MFIKPRATMSKVSEQKEGIKLYPLLFISIFVILSILVAAPIKRMQIEQGLTIPEGFTYWSENQQQEYMEAQQNQTKPIFMYGFPVLGGIGGYLIINLLMSNLLYLSLTLAGSRTSRIRIGNVVTWAMLPFALRELVKFLVVGFNKTIIENPGLSNLIKSDAKGFMAYFRGILGNFDIYWLLFVILLIIGALQISGLKKKKAIITTVIAALIMLALQGLPAFLSSLLGGLSAGGAGFYF